MGDVYNNNDDYNPNKKRKIADIMTNKKFKAIIKELFIRCRKLYSSHKLFCSKRSQIKLYTLLNNENSQ